VSTTLAATFIALLMKDVKPSQQVRAHPEHLDSITLE
jgi:hypothetical protein